MPNKAIMIKFFLISLFACCAVIGLQEHIGNNTIYSDAVRDQRLLLHYSILNNSPPSGTTWDDIGAGSTNIRILAVYLANGIHGLTNMDINTSYKYIDTFSMILFLIVAFYFFEYLSGTTYSLIGVLYMAVSFVTTYSYYYFHPWDRLSLLVWVLLLIALKKNQFAAVAGLLALGMLIKYDVMFVPALYLACTYSRNNALKSVALSLLLLIITFGIYLALTAHFQITPPSAGIHDRYLSALQAISKNFQMFRTMLLSYPPLIVFALPLSFSAYYILYVKNRDRFAICCAIFGIMMFGPYVTVNLHETRALMPILLLLMPAVLLALQKMTDTRLS